MTAELVSWVMSTPNQVEPMAEVSKMRNRLTSDALTYQVGVYCQVVVLSQLACDPVARSGPWWAAAPG